MDIENREIEIIDIKNFIAIIAIGVSIVAILLNENDRLKILNKNPFFDDKVEKIIDVGSSLVTVIATLIAFYVVYLIHELEIFKGENTVKREKENNLQIVASVLSITVALIVLYLTYTSDDEFLVRDNIII